MTHTEVAALLALFAVFALWAWLDSVPRGDR